MCYIFYILIALSATVYLSACGNRSASNYNSGDTRTKDSTAILKLVRDVYSWHDAHVHETDYNVVTSDSFEIGIDSAHLMKRIDQLTKTRFFSDRFIATYKKIGYLADSTLRSGKYYHEINFGFQDADPWNFFQDDAEHFWEHLVVTNFKLNGGNASLDWRIEGISEKNTYTIRFTKINGDWKVDYMEGFDEKVY